RPHHPSLKGDLMQRKRLVRSILGAALLLPLAAAGIGGAQAAVAPPGAATAQVAVATPDAATAQVAGDYGGTFPYPTRTDARYFPLRPGTQFVYDGTVTDAQGSHKHRVIFTVTDLVKVVGGVKTRVIWDQDINDGVLTEAELAFFAQDRHANVWTMGEYPEEYEGGTFTGAPSTWISGQARAQAGILVPGGPTVGTPQFVRA